MLFRSMPCNNSFYLYRQIILLFHQKGMKSYLKWNEIFFHTRYALHILPPELPTFTPPLFTILCTQFIRTVRAFQRLVRDFPEPLGKQHHTKFPDHPDGKCRQHKAHPVKAAHKYQRAEHHKMIPVKNTAGRTASILHDQSERAPYQHTDQIAYIEKNTDQK